MRLMPKPSQGLSEQFMTRTPGSGTVHLNQRSWWFGIFRFQRPSTVQHIELYLIMVYMVFTTVHRYCVTDFSLGISNASSLI